MGSGTGWRWALEAGPGADLVTYLGRLAQELGFDVRHLDRDGQRRLGSRRVALVAGFLQRRVAALLGRKRAARWQRRIGAFTREPPRALHRVRVVAVEARRTPDRQELRLLWEIKIGCGMGSGDGRQRRQFVGVRGAKRRV